MRGARKLVRRRGREPRRRFVRHRPSSLALAPRRPTARRRRSVARRSCPAFPRASRRCTCRRCGIGRRRSRSSRASSGGQDVLQLEPSPAPSLARLLELLSSQPDFLVAVGESDDWVRRAPRAWAANGASFAHRFATARLWLTLDEHRGREPEPWLEDRAGEVFRLMVAIPLAMKREVEAGRRGFACSCSPIATA